MDSLKNTKCKNGSVGYKNSNYICSCDLCKKQHNDYMRKYYQNNKNSCIESRKLHYLKNKTKYQALNKFWKQTNRDAVNATNSKRRSVKINAVPSWYGELDELVMVEAQHLAKLRENATGFKWNVDHMIPLQAKEACGLHCASNIQVIPESVNCAKKNSLELINQFEWIKHG